MPNGRDETKTPPAPDSVMQPLPTTALHAVAGSPEISQGQSADNQLLSVAPLLL
jgi:hypothetical protein